MSEQVHRAQKHYVQFIAMYLRCSRFSKLFWSSGKMINWTNNDWYNVLNNGTCPNRFIELIDIIAMYLRCSRSSKSFWSSGQMINWINNDWYNVLSNGTCPSRFINLRDIVYNLCHVFEMFKILQIVMEFRSTDQLDQKRLVQCPQQRNIPKQAN